VHCLSSSGRRDPRELSTEQCEAIIDELQRMQVFCVNIGGGEPTVRPDFWHLLQYAVDHQGGVKFSTNGVRITPERAAFLASTDYVDVQISLDGATAEVNDAVRGRGSFDMAMKALDNLSAAGFEDAKISVVVTRHNVAQLDEFKKIADDHGATLRLTRLRPSGRGADVWDELHPTAAQQRQVYDWLLRAGENVLTGDSFFHLSAFGEALPGLNLCGAGRVVCLIDPIGDVYACPFAIHETFLAGNVLAKGFDSVWKTSDLFRRLREPQTSGACTSCHFFDTCRGGCMAWRARYEPAVQVRHEARPSVAQWLGRKAFYGTGADLLARRDGRAVAPAVITPWGGALAIALLAQRSWSLPVAATSLVAASARLSPQGGTLAPSLVWHGAGATLSQANALLLRHWWPLTAVLSVASPRIRRAVVIGAAFDTAVDYRRTRSSLDPGRYAAARRLDDLAYGTGLWIGALRGRSFRALLPTFAHRRPRPARTGAR